MELSHLDRQGKAQMVDVSVKADTLREAQASAIVRMKPETLSLLLSGETAKGDVLAVARVAGIMAAKRTADLIPLCHPLAITAAEIHFETNGKEELHITSLVRTTGPTGVEMEALTAVSLAALTVYDMLKAVDRGMEICHVRLESKKGGKSGEFVRPAEGKPDA